MDNNVYKITVVSNNNNGSHTGHEMGHGVRGDAGRHHR